MSDTDKTYIAIDLKSFYASVECVERGLDPLTTNLVVADSSRTNKTICLAVSPSLKSFGIPGRPRLFEVEQKTAAINRERLANARRLDLAVKDKNGRYSLKRASYNSVTLKNDPSAELDYIVATPRMAYYIEYSTRIYSVYLRFVSPNDIHVYSIDEVFIDATSYLKTYDLTAHEFAMKLVREVLNRTGITATAGIGTNLYLAKIAMDIVAKHVQPDSDGVRIAELDEISYRKLLWCHTPLTDFWRVGKGYARKLEENGLYTMGDVARCSIGKSTDYYNEDFLYKLFGINAELLIDHAWGWEPCTIKNIKEYKPSANSLGSGQVLQKPYTFEMARVILMEMTDSLVIELVEKRLATNQMSLTIGYDRKNIFDENSEAARVDRYGRKVPRHAHGSVNLPEYTSSTRMIMDAVMELYERVVSRTLLIRRITVTANRVIPETGAGHEEDSGEYQLDLFTDYGALESEKCAEREKLERERQLQMAVIEIHNKYGKNAILKGIDLQDDATAMERNNQIGGHKA